MSAGEGRTSEAYGTTTAITCGRMEVGPYNHGLCVKVTKNKQRVELGMGHRGSFDQGNTFLGHEDDEPIDFFEQIIH